MLYALRPSSFQLFPSSSLPPYFTLKCEIYCKLVFSTSRVVTRNQLKFLHRLKLKTARKLIVKRLRVKVHKNEWMLFVKEKVIKVERLSKEQFEFGGVIERKFHDWHFENFKVCNWFKIHVRDFLVLRSFYGEICKAKSKGWELWIFWGWLKSIKIYL